MRRFLDIHAEAFGLDISDLSLKFAKLKREKKGDLLEFYGEKDIPEEVIKNGSVAKEEELVSVLGEALSHIPHEELKYAVVSLPEEKTFTTVIKTPLLPEEELDSAVSYEAENTIPFSMEEVYLDFQVLHSHEQGEEKYHEVLVSAAPKAIVDSYLSCLERASIVPLVFETESAAISRALMNREGSQRPTLILDVGAIRTNLMVFSGEGLAFTFSIPVSSYLFTKSIAEKLDIPFEEAESLKRKHGLELWNKVTLKGKKESSPIEQFEMEIEKDKEVLQALEPSLRELVKEVKKHMEYYRTHGMHGGSEPIERVLLSGGGANLKGLPEFLSSELGIPVHVSNPLTNIAGVKEAVLMSSEDSLRYTTALGLALRAVRLHD